MPSLTLLLAALLLPRIWSILSHYLVAARKPKDDSEQLEKSRLAEVDGGVWERLSVFEHIEQGLRKSPDSPAVICMLQPAHCLDHLVTENVSCLAQSPNGLWERRKEYVQKLHNGDHQLKVNGNSTIEQQNLVLWSDREHSSFFDAKSQSNGHKQTSNFATSNCLSLTFSQLHQTAIHLAAGFLANGCQPNTTMVMLIPNSGEYAILLWMCILLRITYVSLDPSSLSIAGFTALKETMKMLKPQIVVVPDALSGKAIDVAVDELQLPEPVRICLSTRSTGQISGWKSLATIASDATKHPVDDTALVNAAREDHPDRIHSIMFTSGTSGRPKGCPMRLSAMSHVLHSQSWLLDTDSAAFALQQPHNSRAIAPAQTLQTWKAGGAVVMTGNEFNVTDALEAIRQFGITFMVLTPPMVHEMVAELSARPADVTCIRRVQVGGDAITRGLLTQCAALFPAAQVCVNHGMTEGGGSFVWPFLRAHTSQIPFFGELAPVGVVAPGSKVRIWDDVHNRPVQRGQLGELHISSPSIIRNYFGRESDQAFSSNETGKWFVTGDMATMSRDGLVFIMGRRKDMIKRAGVGTMPAPIESTIGAFTGSQVCRSLGSCTQSYLYFSLTSRRPS